MPLSPFRWTPAAILMIAGSTHSLAGSIPVVQFGQFPAIIEMSSLDGTDGFVINGIDSGDYSGRSVSNAGDINGDGVDDLVIGALYADPNGGYSGESYVVFGGSGVGAGGSLELSSLNGANGFILNGIDASDYSGNSVSSAGDVIGDGFGDLIIGGYFGDPNGNSASGESYIVFGGVGIGATGTLELSALNGTNGFVINGIDAGDQSGYSVSAAGDVNGDGIDDVIIGATRATPNGALSGESYVVFGGIGVGSSGSLELSSLNGTNGFVINSIDPGDFSGRSVASAGDVNDDGIDDLIIGAYQAHNPMGFFRGETNIVFGSVGIGAGGILNLSSLNGTNGFICFGVGGSDQSGVSVSSAGDVNGDGVSDIIIGAWQADAHGDANSGESYVVFGASGVGSSGTLELSTLDGTNGFVCKGIDRSDYSGYSVSGAGDINGDGFDDLIIGAFDGDPNGVGSGESYIVFGTTFIGFGGTVELSTLNGATGFVCFGVDADDNCGHSVSSAGDINGDGVDDLIISAPYADPNGSNDAGESYIVFGRAPLAADANSDGIVDTADLGILLGTFGQMSP